MTIIAHPASAASGDLEQARQAAVEAHEAACAAWGRAAAPEDVIVARRLSRAAVVLASMDADWLEQLHAATLDCEVEHAADLHAEAAARLQTAWAPPYPPVGSR
ncbi:hypothetical protein JKL49_01075 [Phenylobacterium sp. 20VBR1]|uniref:Uncharacterized protein n=1 Tax=Phenylobacterium glaciei TaxID=2803784 RepID=A0A941CWG1_9CAUL|nr:hypothetical protein [Phenylobacterium glaciei]MBR7617965.1 hypothetical protein [Phenylobacterium glaciei]QQZ50559.1 hypothetical protein JKL49_03175 [Phenylobacterium glaciei]